MDFLTAFWFIPAKKGSITLSEEQLIAKKQKIK